MIGWAIVLTVLTLTAVSILLFRRLASRLVAEDCNPEWLENFSTANYVPMQRLLDQSDFEFLKAQPGYKPEIARQLRAERREILAGYLQLLTSDFNQLLAMAKLMLVYSDEDRPGFGGALFWQQLTFYYAVTTARWRLALTRLGWTLPDLRKLTEPIANMHLELQRMAVRSLDAA